MSAFAGISYAGSCLNGACHEDKVDYKNLHGPLAAEEIMGNGCNQCHLPDGKECAEDDAGKYTFMTPKEVMCTSCHEKGESPEHIERVSGCLKCHSPHGSDVSPYMLRKL
jgi:putative hemolysin